MPAQPKHSRKVWSVADARMRRVAASYDIARTTDENANLWKYVDSLSAAEANSPTVRKVVRERARYEVANNAYADGIVDTLANDTIGPEIHLQLGDSDAAQRVENAFASWARAINLWAKVRTMRRAKCVDGEAFGLFITNRSVPHRVKLDVRLIECDCVESWTSAMNENEIDGIRFDAEMNPLQYRVLRVHPGDYRRFLKTLAGEWIQREFVLHYFTEMRPGQVRGISELVSALSLFGHLRSYTAAVISTAARQAENSGIMHTDLPPDKVAADLADPLTVIEAQRNAITSLPEGWEYTGFEATQPTTTYAEFKREIITEAGRCVSMPANVVAGDSSAYNYASGRLDYQTYDRGIEVERADLRIAVLDRVLAAWMAEYRNVANLSEREADALTETHDWHFAGRGHVDPAKEANADDMRLRNGTATRARLHAKQGEDWKREGRQAIRERIELEKAWNDERAAADLPPAPYPFGREQDQQSAATADNGDQEDEGRTQSGRTRGQR